MSTARFNKWENTDGTENYKCRALVNFNGYGTVAIRMAQNVSSITDNGTGDFTINFISAMQDANYVPHITIGNQPSSGNIGYLRDATAVPTTSALRIATQASSAGLVDADRICVSVFR